MPHCPAGHEITEEQQMAADCPVCNGPQDGPCTCGEMYEGRPCAPDCATQDQED